MCSVFFLQRLPCPLVQQTPFSAEQWAIYRANVWQISARQSSDEDTQRAKLFNKHHRTARDSSRAHDFSLRDSNDNASRAWKNSFLTLGIRSSPPPRYVTSHSQYVTLLVEPTSPVSRVTSFANAPLIKHHVKQHDNSSGAAEAITHYLCALISPRLGGCLSKLRSMCSKHMLLTSQSRIIFRRTVRASVFLVGYLSHVPCRKRTIRWPRFGLTSRRK